MLLPCIWWWSWGTCADVPDLPAAGNMHARCCCSDAVHAASGACMAWPWPCPALEGSDPEPSVNMLGSGVVRGLVRSPPARPVTATCGTAHGRRRPGRYHPSPNLRLCHRVGSRMHLPVLCGLCVDDCWRRREPATVPKRTSPNRVTTRARRARTSVGHGPDS